MIHCSSIPGQRVEINNSIIELLKYIDAPVIPTKPAWEVALKVVFYIIAILGAIIGNVIVLLIVVLQKKLRTTTNILITNLAISEIMVGVFCMWVHLGNQISSVWPFGGFMCKFATFVQVLSVTLSVLTLTCVSIERFLAIVFPMKGKLSQSGVIILISGTWIISTAIATPQLFVRDLIEIKFRNRKDEDCQERWTKYYIDTNCNSEERGKKIYYVVQGVVMYIIPVFVMVVAYGVVIARLVCRKMPGNVMSSTAVKDRTKKKVLKMLLVVVAAFIICWTPQQTFLLWDVYRSRNEQLPKYVLSLKYVAVYLAYFNSAINPVIYGALNDNFRKGFSEAFKCQLWRKRNRVYPDSKAGQSRGNGTMQTSSAKRTTTNKK